MTHDYFKGHLTRGPKGAFTKHTRPIYAAVVHYTATWPGSPITPEDVDRWHRDRGWNGFGYHVMIMLDGRIAYGRPLDAQGAHTGGHNNGTLSLVFEGGLTEAGGKIGSDTRTVVQKAAMEAVLTEWSQKFPGLEIEGHRDMPKQATQCPGFDANAWWHSRPARPTPKAAPVRTPPTWVEWFNQIAAAISAAFMKGN